jgi:hypothetical protein
MEISRPIKILDTATATALPNRIRFSFSPPSLLDNRQEIPFSDSSSPD